MKSCSMIVDLTHVRVCNIPKREQEHAQRSSKLDSLAFSSENVQMMKIICIMCYYKFT